MKQLIIRRRKLKNKLRSRENVYAGWNSFGHSSLAEFFAKAGVDFVGIDIEHSTISYDQCREIMISAQGENSLCFPRIASHNQEMMKRLMDTGADGLIVPMVSSAKEAEGLISWFKYPPKGNRSFGVARAQGYGLDYDEYVKSWNDSSSLIFQIENIQGVENIEEILKYEDVDGVMIGPYDISGSLGIAGQLNHPRVKKAAEKVIKACLKYKRACGTQIVEPDKDNVREAFDKGYTFVVLGSDLFMFWKWAERLKKIISRHK